MYYKVMIELHIDPDNYDMGEDFEFDLEDVLIDELYDLCRTDILSACEVEEIN